MKTEMFLLILALGGAFRANSAEQASATNAPVKASTNWQDFQMDADDRAMIDSWPKGLPTNGLFCALQLDRPVGAKERPVCYAYVVNQTTNFFRTILNLPREVLYQVELFDSEGKPVEKTPAGKQFTTWTQNQIEDWLREQLRARWHGKFIMVLPVNYYQVGTFGIPEIFQLTRPGEYMLHLRMQLVEAKWDTSEKFHLQTKWLPEVVAKIQIRPDDIPQPNPPPPGQTNAPAK